MAVYEALLLNTVVPQIQAAQAGDSYVMVVNATTPALRITQTGTGNALEVEDSANPDATPFVVSAAGDVGIGTNAPSNKLTVNSGAATTAALIESTGTSVFAGLKNSGSIAYIGSDNTGAFLVQTPGSGFSTKLTLDTSGNLGLGTTSPNSPAGSTQTTLHISNSTAGTSPGIHLTNGNTGTNAGDGTLVFVGNAAGTGTTAFNIYNQESSPICFFTDTTEKMRLDASGNLGLGVTPSAWGANWKALQGGTGSAFASYVGASQTWMFANAYADGAASYRYINTAAATAYQTTGGQHFWYTAPSGTAGNPVSFTQVLTLDGIDGSGYGKNLKLGGTADRATTKGTHHFDIFDGTAPVGTLANGISLYSSSGEAYVMDAAGNATLFSPHDSETNEWIFKSKHTPSGKVLKIDVEKMLRFINDHFGLDAIHEFTEE